MSTQHPLKSLAKSEKSLESVGKLLLEGYKSRDDEEEGRGQGQGQEGRAPSQDQVILTPKLSKRRWFILFATCSLGLSAAIASHSASILDPLLGLLDLRTNQYIYINQMFYYLVLVMMVPSAMFADKYGIRASLYAAACCFVLTGIFRWLLYSPHLPAWRGNKMLYYILASLFNMQLFVLFIPLPLKVSETWFSASERSVAWTVMMSQYEVGACICSLVYPRLIQSLDDFEVLAKVNLVAVAIATCTCLTFATKSEPEHPPSKRMAEASKDNATSVLVAIKRMLTQWDILLHQLHNAIATSVSLTIASVLQNILASIGFSPIFTGNYLTLNSLVSIVMLMIMAGFVHKVKDATWACKVSSLAQGLLFIGLMVCMVLPAPGYVILIASIAATICKSWAAPHINDMTAHLACGTVSQATIVGFSVIVTTITLSIIQVTFAYLIETTETDYHKSLMFLVVVCALNELAYLVMFRGGKEAAATSKAQVDHQEASR